MPSTIIQMGTIDLTIKRAKHRLWYWQGQDQ